MANHTAIGQDLLNVPMGDMILQMALAIAEAQFELDKSSILVAEMMGGQQMLRNASGDLVDYDDNVLENKRDVGGNPIYDSRGSLVYEEGQGPRIKDSRVFFGYTYEPLMEADGSTAQTWPNGATKMVRKPRLVSMMELGFTPNFYQFVDTIIEVKIAIKVTDSNEDSRRSSSSSRAETQQDLVKTVKTRDWSFGAYRARSSPSGSSVQGFHASGASYAQKKVGTQSTVNVQNVDAQYTNKYNYSAEGASLLRTKLVPVPPPAILEERIRDVMAEEKAYQELASQGLHGVLERIGDNDTPVSKPNGTMAKVDRSLGDRSLTSVPTSGGDVSVFLPEASVVASTGVYSSYVGAAYTFVVPSSLQEGRFTVEVLGDGAVTVHYSGNSSASVPKGSMVVVTLSGGAATYAVSAIPSN